MKTARSVRYWNRTTRKCESELIYGEGLMRWLYESALGGRLAKELSRPWLSRLYGQYQDSRLSARQIGNFVKNYGIHMEEFEAGPFRSFNEFFVRKFKPGARSFPIAGEELGAFAEARYLAFERISSGTRFPIKGMKLSAEDLLGDARRAKPFMGGPLFVARLCPTDYHRYHYPDSGQTRASYPVAGALHSVSPVALSTKGDILVTNERRVSLLETCNFGLLAYVEVGALCVGKIVQTHPESRPFERGAEKGYFLFGASTVVLLGEPGCWVPDEDLLEQTAQGRETWVKLGERIGRRA